MGTFSHLGVKTIIYFVSLDFTQRLVAANPHREEAKIQIIFPEYLPSLCDQNLGLKSLFVFIK